LSQYLGNLLVQAGNMKEEHFKQDGNKLIGMYDFY